MKVITVRQPYASLIAAGVKTIETRSCRTGYRGRVGIHATKAWEPGWRGVWVSPDWYDDDLLHDELRRHELLVETLGCDPIEDRNGSGYWTVDTRIVPLGVIVASALLTDCVPIIDESCPIPEGPFVYGDLGNLVQVHDGPDDHAPRYSEDEVHYGDFSPGRWALLLDDIKPTTERCPVCWGWGMCRAGGVDDDLTVHIGPCPVCDGATRCDPVPARGRQAVPWEWTP